jgi:hypothetical protein
MALSQISDLWTPDIWVKAIREKQATFPSLLNSGIAVNTPLFDEIATGSGTSATVPFFKDITGQDDEIQVENTAATVLGLTGDTMVAPILTARRLKQRNKTLYALLRGAFNTAGASGASAPLSSQRVDSFDETGTDATGDQTFNPDLFITGKALLGELSDELMNGALLLHPNVMASLERADKESFQTGVESGLPFTIRTYRGIPVFTSELLYRAGSSNGYVYNTFLFAKGVVAKGEKMQASGSPGSPAIDVASLNYNPDVNLNNERIYDRTRHVMHLNGMKWTGTPSGQSATDAELATYTNWSYVYTTQNRSGIVCFRTNA